MISEKTLKKWRAQALVRSTNFNPKMYEQTNLSSAKGLAECFLADQKKILDMTQELLDKYLLGRAAK